MEKMKAIVALSGGVDSSVAASLLAEEGYSVMGLTMNLYSCHREGGRSCCSARDRMDAREVCERLGLALKVVDLRERFRESIICPFVEEYLAGRTPSPCILCNETIKFPVLFEECNASGADVFATGHYARVVEDGGLFRLFRARDERKDQSYFLFRLQQDVLSRLVLPLGEMTKDQVRERAKQLGLPVHQKPESQEICFVPDDDYAAFLESTASQRLSGPGDFIVSDGTVIGRHRGIHAYTIGQRRGLGIGGGGRKYVVSIDNASNSVTLGEDADLMRDEMNLRAVTWIDPSFEGVRRARVRIRSTHEGELAVVEPMPGGCARVKFDKAVRAIAPGQAAVFYEGEEVLGGGWIE